MTKMNYKMVTVGFVACMMATMSNAGVVSFQPGDTDYVYEPQNINSGGDKVVSMNSWAIALCQDVAGDGIDNFFSNNDDTVLYLTSRDKPGANPWNLDYDGWFSTPTADVVPDAAQVFVRIFDSSDAGDGTLANHGTATQYVDLPVLVKAGNTHTVNLDASGYDSFKVGSSAQNGSDWQPVPEPATLALLGAGMVAVIARRRMKKA
jgi:hypothetical protein